MGIPLRSIDSGSNVQAEADQYEQLIVLSQGGSLQQAAIDGRLFSAANTTKVATTSGITTTWTGLGISNPAGSGKNLIIHEFGYSMMIASDVAGLVGLQTATSSGFADAITKYNCLDGASAGASVAYADDGATLVTPVLKRVYGMYGTEDTATSLNVDAPYAMDLKGGLVIPPGRAVATYTTLATTACFVFHFVWEEVSVLS